MADLPFRSAEHFKRKSRVSVFSFLRREWMALYRVPASLLIYETARERDRETILYSCILSKKMKNVVFNANSW